MIQQKKSILVINISHVGKLGLGALIILLSDDAENNGTDLVVQYGRFVFVGHVNTKYLKTSKHCEYALRCLGKIGRTNTSPELRSKASDSV